MRLEKGIFFTDIHFGKKSNSPTHNQDCIDFLLWVKDQVAEHNPNYLAFLGDWHESRSSLLLTTLHQSYKGAEILNSIGIPVYFLVGNHDMAMRHSRDVFSTIPFNEFSNFNVVSDPTVVKDINDKKMLFCPYLLSDEYHSILPNYIDCDYWAGHFEFKDFVITGQTIKMQEGPDHRLWDMIDKIFSGHYHKRQNQDNVYFIGNTFPMDFSDANDFDRGIMIFDHNDASVEYVNWEYGPKYQKLNAREVLNGTKSIFPHSYVKLDSDIPLTYEDQVKLENTLRDKFQARDIEVFYEEVDIETQNEETDDDARELSTEDFVIKCLHEIESDQFDVKLLVDIFKGAK